MLKAEEAKKIGLRACIDKIGFEFCKKHADATVYAYGEDDGVMQCYVGIDDQPELDYENLKPEEICLSSVNYAPYFAICEVYMEDGTVTFLDFCQPEERE